MISDIIKRSKKIVIKIGSNTLSNEDGTINKEFLNKLTFQVSKLREMDKQVIIVSSGAIISGVCSIGKWSRKEDIHYKQALSSIGQVELMNAYLNAFNKYDLTIGQVLLTREDFLDNYRTLNIRNTLFTLVDEGIIPIVNENDTICVEEIKIGDNDTLSALTTNLFSADLLVLLSDIDGVYDKSPKEYDNAVMIETVTNIDELLKNITIGKENYFGTGGIATKIEAAKKVNKYGIPMILANGKKENILMDLLENKAKSTLFLP